MCYYKSSGNDRNYAATTLAEHLKHLAVREAHLATVSFPKHNPLHHGHGPSEQHDAAPMMLRRAVNCITFCIANAAQKSAAL